MSVVVLGCGRSGTNMALEILSGNSHLKTDSVIENKFLCKGNVYPGNYLTKCDTTYFNYKELDALLCRNPNMKIVWCIRDPRDICLSNMRRGETFKNGGDCPVFCSTSTPKGSLENIQKMFNVFLQVEKSHSNRLYLFKMEDFILTMEENVKTMCQALGLPYDKRMLNFMDRMRNNLKKKRYNGIDKSQVGIWRDLDRAYDGYFNSKEYDLQSLFKSLEEYITYFGYEGNK